VVSLKVFVEITRFAGSASREQLRDRVRALEDAGAAGVSVWDHLFTSNTVGFESTPYPCDPLTALAAIGALSDRLELLTVVMNSQWIHPGLLLRQFAQLAVLTGGARVTAGLGAGWSKQELTALGMEMPPFRQRVDRLEETMRIARQLYHEGEANVDGDYVSARRLPLNPVPSVLPRLLVGGGSDRILEIAGRYADVIDLFADPKHGKMAGPTMWDQHVSAMRRRALSTVDDLAERVERLRGLARAAGRPEDSVSAAVQINQAIYASSRSEVTQAEERLCSTWGNVPPRSLAACPYVLVGEPREMADKLVECRERFGLAQIEVQEQIDGAELCRKVLPLIA
jgi:alkanesulfonate monooxygenase SsuD/methylene tetrahydromethanopterin reductase-like flavin-dependent oxidoreductase (luciferase family)